MPGFVNLTDDGVEQVVGHGDTLVFDPTGRDGDGEHLVVGVVQTFNAEEGDDTERPVVAINGTSEVMQVKRAKCVLTKPVPTPLSETSPSLVFALKEHNFDAYTQHTGGGVMVLVVKLGRDGRRQLWLTREGPNEWLLGFYDFAYDDCDEGVCVSLNGHLRPGAPRPYSPDDPTAYTSDDPEWVAGRVRELLFRMGVR